MPNGFFTPLDRDGWVFLGLFVFVTLLLFWSWWPLGCVGVVLSLWCAYFFRDPVRVSPVGHNWVLSPADGVISGIGPAMPPAEIGLGAEPLMRISVFMNVFNVHVNRSPVDGNVAAIAYRKGRFFNASLDKASQFNERNALRIATSAGPSVGVVQIAGLVARRIRCDAKVGDMVFAGQKFGLIRFGSRVDVYLPSGIAPLVSVGQTMVAGETVMADLAGGAAERPAVLR